MNRRISVIPEAQADIREIGLWYEKRDEGLGFRLRNEVRAALRRASENPLVFPIIDTNIHRALLGTFPYSVYFTVKPDAIVVIAVLHQRRRPDTWRERLQKPT